MSIGAAERFWAKVDKAGPTAVARPDLGPCWVWTGGTSNGYGRFWFEGRVMPAHRWAYEQEHGPIPEGQEPDHLCRVHGCVRPSHLEAVTRAENTRRGLAPEAGRRFQQAKTECPQGHSYAEHARIYRGHRICRRCTTDRQRERRARAREAA